MKGSRRKATEVPEMSYCLHDMHSSRRMFMTIVRVLLPKSSWKHKEGAILNNASTVPHNCRMKTTAIANNIQEEVEDELQGQQRSSKDLWFLLGEKNKGGRGAKDQD